VNVVSAVSSPQPTPDNSQQIDTGLECLATIGARYRRAVDREHLKHELNLQDKLIGVRDLAKAAHMVGLKARLFTSKSFQSLAVAPRPSIVEVGGGFAILVATEGGVCSCCTPISAQRGP
jgi:subfamily B ATP-binding cassette protein HlyB/CyaB